MENSAFISDDELIEYIDSAYTEMYDLLVGLYELYNLAAATLVTVANTQIYNLPANFYKLVGVDAEITGNKKISLERIEFADRNNEWDDLGTVNEYSTNLKYNIIGDTLMLNPSPQAGLNLTIWYTPVAPKLTQASQIIEGTNGYEELIVLEAAIRCHEKQEMSTTSLLRQKDSIIRRIEELGQNRDSGTPRKVSDARGLTTVSYLGFGRKI